LLDRAAARPGERVLDIGCGGGVTSAELARQVGPNGEVVGVDVSDVILDVARQRYAGVANLRFDAGDAQSMALPARAFDLITSRFGVMFFEDPVAAFGNLRASLGSGGRLVFMCWRTPPENPWMTMPAAAVFGVLGPPPPPDPEAPGPFAFGAADRVRRILGESGFVDIALEPIDVPVDLGSIERAVRLMSELGPAAALLEDASEKDRARAIEAVAAALRPFATADGLKLPSAAWVVSARPQ
jgi:SAM-dependent methyltransferase